MIDRARSQVKSYLLRQVDHSILIFFYTVGVSGKYVGFYLIVTEM